MTASDTDGPIFANRSPCRTGKTLPDRFGKIAAGEPMHADAAGQSVMTLTANGFALACGERAEEFVESCKAAILPVKLLVGALQITKLAEEAGLRFRCKGHMHAGCAANLANFDETRRKRAGDIFGIGGVAD